MTKTDKNKWDLIDIISLSPAMTGLIVGYVSFPSMEGGTCFPHPVEVKGQGLCYLPLWPLTGRGEEVRLDPVVHCEDRVRDTDQAVACLTLSQASLCVVYRWCS